ncbi:type IV pilus modification protein PilV [Melaminivora alkalimesophila]|nr:type IV pilus modification protein PilV [Melaminivora alkalimesophila]
MNRSSTLLPEQGATLIEVLVAMVIMAIALLGMAGVTSASIKYNQFSRMQANGLSLVTDYAERARANLNGFDDYGITDSYAPSTRTSAATNPTTPIANCIVDATDPTQPTNTCGTPLANYDKEQWLTTVANRLPGGTAYVETEFTPAPPDMESLPATRILNIWLIWTAPEESSGFGRGRKDCPAGANISNADSVNCMSFRITL